MPVRALRSILLIAVAGLLLGVPVAGAATKPAVTTGGATNVVQQSARIAGQIDPNGAPTTYSFQYGRTTAYGQSTPELSVTGDGRRGVSVDLTGLTAATKYHYRLVARNSAGQTIGANRSFTTPKAPLGITIAATPNPVVFGSGTTIAGQVTGTGNAGVNVALQSNPFPYTQGFKQVGNVVVAGADGSFSFLLPALPMTTQYRVVRAGASLASPVALVGVQPVVSTRVGTYRVRRNARLTFSGTIRPALPGTLMALQKKKADGSWALIAGMVSRTSNSEQSKYKVRVRIPRGGTYRVYAGIANGKFVPTVGREVRIRLR